MKRFAWSGSAVFLALVLALGLMTPAPVAAGGQVAVTGGATTVLVSSNRMNGTAAWTSLATNIVLTADATADGGVDFPLGTIVLAAPTGFEWNPAIAADVAGAGNVATGAAVTYSSSTNGACAASQIISGCPHLIITVTTVSDQASDTITLGNTLKPQLRPTNPLAATGAVTLSSFSTSNVSGLPGVNLVAITGTALTATSANYVTRIVFNSTTAACSSTTLPPTGIVDDAEGADATDAAGNDAFAALDVTDRNWLADGTNPGSVCAMVYDSAGVPASGAIVALTSSVGYLGSGTARSAACITGSSGACGTNYRGAGGIAATDTVISASTALNTVGTATTTITAPSGNTATKLVMGAADVLALGQQLTGASAYMPTRFGTQTYVQVQDANGLGVNSQTLMITVDRGGIIDGAGNCTGGAAAARSITPATATEVQGGLGSAVAGTATFTVCSNGADAAGKINVTVQNISTVMATATSSVTMAARPAKIDVTATTNTISAKVSDAAGNTVADGTPVRFTLSATAGALSTTCSPTTNGVATSVVALIAATGTVIVSTDWNENTNAAGCTVENASNYIPARIVANGPQSIVTSVSLPGGAAPVTAGAATVSGTVPATGFGLIVASGKITDVVTAVKCAGTSSALYATVGGEFVAYVPGTTIAAVNAAFLAAFKDGVLPASTALIGKC